MTPYYSEAGQTIYHGDAREVLPTIDACDAVVTDPPYGTGRYETDTNVLSASLLSDLIAMAPTAIFGYAERLIALCVAVGTVPDEWVTWWPTNGRIRGFNLTGLWREAESIAVFGQANWASLRQPRSTNSTAIAKVGNARVVAGLPMSQAHMTHIELDLHDTRCGDVWTFASPGLGFASNQRLHPNEKPVELMRRLISAFTGDLILDPFMGSGTTLRAAKDLGRKATGIELEERYCEIAARRLSQEVLDFGGAA